LIVDALRPQFVSSRFKFYLPTEEELIAELKRERQVIEMERRLAGVGDE
jgi:hypothetical protein